MTKSNKAAKSALIIIIFTLGSKVLGFIREVLIAWKFGSGMETDTFFIALSATGLISGFISNAITTTFIPILSEIEPKEGKKGKINHMNNIIHVIMVLSIVLVSIGFIFTPVIVKILAKGFQGEQFNLAVKLTRIGLPMILLSGIIGVFTGYLQSENKFTSSAAIGFPFNIVYIFFLLFLSARFGIVGLMVTGVLAIFSQLLIQIPEAKSSGYKYQLIFDLKDQYIKRILLLSLPILISVAINDINTIVDKTLASDLVSGSISALNYASKLNGLVRTVFISAITTVIFPLLSKESNNDNIPAMKKIMGKGVNIILLITVPVTIGLIILPTPIVQIAFERGKFDSTATLMTSQALIFYSVGLVSMALKALLNRVYYSLQDTKTPMINAFISLFLNMILNLILIRFMAHAGLALATSLSSIITTFFMFYMLKKKIGSLGTKDYLTTFFKTGLASTMMGIVVYVVYYGLYNMLGVSKLYNLISLLFSVGIGIIIYGVLCYLFDIKEVRDAVESVKEKIRKY